MEAIDEKIRNFLEVADGYGSGYGSGYGYVNRKKIYRIDGVETIIDSVRGNVAKGAIFNRDFTFSPCFIVKESNEFAHGKTLREAFAALQEKLYDSATEEERLQAFKKKFPEYDTPYSNADLYAYHHVLTGSCKMDRDNFKEQHGLSLDGEMTVREFVELTKNSYGGNIIRELPNVYDK